MLAASIRARSGSFLLSNKRFFGIVAVLFGLMPILPIFALSLAYLFRLIVVPSHALDAMSDQQLTSAAINSLFVGLPAATLGVLVSVAFIMTLATYRMVSMLLLCLLFLPGFLAAHGFDVLSAHLVSESGSVAIPAVTLILALTGYVLPFQAIILITTVIGYKRSEKYAAAEYFQGWFAQIAYWLGRLRGTLVATFVIGLALAFTECPRSQVLGKNFFGLGGQYFGPLFVGHYYTQEIPDLYVFVSSILVVIGFAFVWRPWLASYQNRQSQL